MAKLISGINDLGTVNPVLAAEWHPTRNGALTPEMVTCGSNKKVWWLGKACGHEWETFVSARRTGLSNRYVLRHGCPVCTSRKIVPGVNDLATVKPELIAEWDVDRNAPLTPEAVAPFSNQKVWWRCRAKGHLYLSSIASRSYGHACPMCLGMTPYRKKYTP